MSCIVLRIELSYQYGRKQYRRVQKECKMETFIVIKNGIENRFFGISQAIRFMSDVVCEAPLKDLLRIARSNAEFGQGVLLFTEKGDEVSFWVSK
jgi:hypothetical protein